MVLAPDDMPLAGYVPMRNRKSDAPSFTPELPGVYLMMAIPKDDWMYGQPDFVRVIVGAREPAGK